LCFLFFPHMSNASHVFFSLVKHNAREESSNISQFCRRIVFRHVLLFSRHMLAAFTIRKHVSVSLFSTLYLLWRLKWQVDIDFWVVEQQRTMWKIVTGQVEWSEFNDGMLVRVWKGDEPDIFEDSAAEENCKKWELDYSIIQSRIRLGESRLKTRTVAKTPVFSESRQSVKVEDAFFKCIILFTIKCFDPKLI
jgi:hypothetical protein